MKVARHIDSMLWRYEKDLQNIQKTLQILEPFKKKTPEDAQKMFENEPSVTLHRRNGWLNEDEKWKIAFYAQKLPRRSSKPNCGLHLYEIAAKFNVSLHTVYKYGKWLNNHYSYVLKKDVFYTYE